MTSTVELKEALAAHAKTLGFGVCRVTKCAAPPHAAEFEQWLDEGRAGEMAWLGANRERRTDPQKVLPGARSIIVLAMNYWQGGEPAGPRVARYAWGEDYHELIAERLRKMDALLKERGGIQRCYVDTGPMLERDFAARAGAGWHGKSTMLVNPEMGTWFFLAEILTTLELDEDAPQPDRCGSCTRCITACPTGAIVAPRELDARRCISYLTIESKGSIPEELRPLMGNRIYGCDDCLAVCPWNRFAREGALMRPHYRPDLAAPDLIELLSLDKAAFERRFAGTPIRRAKRRGLLRNVCVALGNNGHEAALPALERAATDAEPLVAEHARWAIARIQERATAAAPIFIQTG